jgi:tyrosyl-tRNA synthetase
MTDVVLPVFDDLVGRGLVSQNTPDLGTHLTGGRRTLYCGFDPTAESLHIGSLVPLLALRRFQLAGHRPVALVGGATGLVGDPSFKAQERSLNPGLLVAEWTESIFRQVSRFLDTDGPNAALVVNNLEWFESMSFIGFLRDVGKYFSVNTMINKDSVRQRIDREGAGLSFAEFSYMLLQAYDFAELHRRYGCTIQLGGSDQWGNITAGIDLCRRLNSAHVQALTLPLVTKADGTKFGKTESGTVWLDPKKTSPYSFFQFWLMAGDADVYRFLAYFTFLPAEEISAVRESDLQASGRPRAQRLLAEEVTRLVHGAEGLESAVRITDALFSGVHHRLSEQDLMQLLLDGIPSSSLSSDALQKPLTGILVDVGLASSGKQAKDALSNSALLINGHVTSMEDNMAAPRCFAVERAMYGRFFLARLGKRSYHLFELV